MFKIPPESDGLRIDRFLKDHFPLVSRAEIVGAVDSGKIRIGNRRAVKGERLKGGDALTLDSSLSWAEPRLIPNPSLPLNIIFSDPDLLIVDKPGGMPVHPLRWEETGTLANALIARFPELGNMGGPPKEAGCVHRLDTGTSGLVVVARTSGAYEVLRRYLTTEGMEKIYMGLVWGRVEGSGEIVRPIASEGRGSPRVKVGTEGRPARTLFQASATGCETTLLRLTIVGPGQRHQLRAHLASIGHPIVGDHLYGTSPERFGLPHGRYFLHASRLVFPHPVTGKRLEASAGLPRDLEEVLKTQGLDKGTSKNGPDARPPPPKADD